VRRVSPIPLKQELGRSRLPIRIPINFTLE
jgi:hypothetical protein